MFLKLLPSQLCRSREPCRIVVPVRPHPRAPFVPAERSASPMPLVWAQGRPAGIQGISSFFRVPSASAGSARSAGQAVRWLRGNMRLRCILNLIFWENFQVCTNICSKNSAGTPLRNWFKIATIKHRKGTNYVYRRNSP